MAAKFSAPSGLHDLPASVSFTLADGTRLTAAVRLSPRARRAKLSLDPRGGLTLTTPLAMRPEQMRESLPLFLPWLERAWKKRATLAAPPALPPGVALPLSGQHYNVICAGDMAAGRRAAASAERGARTLLAGRGAQRVLLLETPELLRLFGSVDDAPLCANVLRQWCRETATRLLPPFLETLAAKGGFALADVTVRDQRGRWGSCSRLREPGVLVSGHFANPGLERTKSLPRWAKKVRNFFTEQLLPLPEEADDMSAMASSCPPPPLPQQIPGRININWRALLLPLPLLEHLCWHELCHLRHMNHSPAYRKELGRYSPQWPDQEKALNAAWRGLPWWALPGGDAS